MVESPHPKNPAALVMKQASVVRSSVTKTREENEPKAPERRRARAPSDAQAARPNRRTLSRVRDHDRCGKRTVGHSAWLTKCAPLPDRERISCA